MHPEYFFPQLSLYTRLLEFRHHMSRQQCSKCNARVVVPTRCGTARVEPRSAARSLLQYLRQDLCLCIKDNTCAYLCRQAANCDWHCLQGVDEVLLGFLVQSDATARLFANFLRQLETYSDLSSKCEIATAWAWAFARKEHTAIANNVFCWTAYSANQVARVSQSGIKPRSSRR